MKKIKIFLASSNELKEERDKFQKEILAKLYLLLKENILLELFIWENIPKNLYKYGSQNEYNKYIRSSDMFVLVVDKKVGEYSLEEFDTALENFNTEKKPLIYTFIKKNTDGVQESLELLIKRVSELKHFYIVYENSDELWNKFNVEIDTQKDNIGSSGNFLNNKLTKRLIEAIDKQGRKIDFLEKAKTKDILWENNLEYKEQARALIAEEFSGVLGSKIQYLIAIGQGDESDVNVRKSYLEECLASAKIAIQLLCFSLISVLWDISIKDSDSKFKDSLENYLIAFFESVAPSLTEYIELLKKLTGIFITNQIPFPVADAVTFEKITAENSNFDKAYLRIIKINDAFRNSKDYSSANCYDAEEQLCAILENLVFFVNYKIASIRSVEYDESRHNPPGFLHHFIELGISNTDLPGGESVKYVNMPINTYSVLLYKDNRANGINLSPFIIDINALKFEKKPNICFLSHKSNDKLKYRTLDNNSEETIDFSSNIEGRAIDELMGDEMQRKQYNFNKIILQLNDATKNLSGT